MIKRVYAVYDKATAAFAQPFYARTDAEAVRMMVASVSANAEFRANAHDYELMYLSDYDDVVGQFGVPEGERLSVPRKILSGAQAAMQAREMVPPGVEAAARVVAAEGVE